MIEVGINFILTIVSGIISGVFSAIIVNKLYRKNQVSKAPEIKKPIVVVVYPKYPVETVTKLSSSSTDENDSTLMLVLFALGAYAYIVYNSIFHLVFLGISLFIISFLISIIVFARKSGIRFGKEWNSCWITLLVFSLIIPVHIFVSINPIKKGLTVSEIIYLFKNPANGSFFEISNLHGITMMLYTVAGFFFLFLAIYWSILSLIHLLGCVKMTISTQSNLGIWILQKTRKYRNPYKNIRILIFINILAFFFISGLAYFYFHKLIN